MKEGKPSRTSGVVARGLVYVYHAYPELELVAPETARWACRFLDQLEKGQLIHWHRLFEYSIARGLFCLFERCGIPGLTLHQSIRKRLIATQVKRYLHDGKSSLVVIGGGLDTLALELCVAGDPTKIVELDHPWTQQTKKLTLEAHSSDAPALRLVEFDAGTQSLGQILKPLDSISDGRTIFVCEGVLMYLPEIKVKTLLHEIATTFPGAVVIFTFMDQSRHGSPHFVEATLAARCWLRLVGEPFMWGYPKSEIGSFLAACGLQLIDIQDTRNWSHQEVNEHGPPVASGEYVGIAQCQ